MNYEQILLQNALIYEGGHKRRTEHILKVYSMTRLLAISENVNEHELVIVSAAAILHDIPIKQCKELYGDACQTNQKREAPAMVREMMLEAGYDMAIFDEVLTLVLQHHNYEDITSKLLRVLIEADLLVNYMEDPEHCAPNQTAHLIQSDCAKKLLKAMRLQ